MLPAPQKLLPDLEVFLGLELLEIRLVEEEEEFVAVADAEVDVDGRRVVEHHRRQRQLASVPGSESQTLVSGAVTLLQTLMWPVATSEDSCFLYPFVLINAGGLLSYKRKDPRKQSF